MVDLINKTFDSNNTKEYSLSIQVSLDGFSFLISSGYEVVSELCTPLKISGSNLVFRHLNDWVATNSILRSDFGSTRIFIFEPSFTMIPDEFNRQNIFKNADLLFFSKGMEFIDNPIEGIKALARFQIEKELSETLKKLFPDAGLIHPVTILAGKHIDHEFRNSAFLIQSKNDYFLVIRRNDKLILANNFNIQHQTDLVYHLVNTFQQLQVARSQTRLFIAGAIHPATELEKLLQPYFPGLKDLTTNEYDNLNLHRFLHFK